MEGMYALLMTANKKTVLYRAPTFLFSLSHGGLVIQSLSCPPCSLPPSLPASLPLSLPSSLSLSLPPSLSPFLPPSLPPFLPPSLPPSLQECVVGLSLFHHSLYVNDRKVATGAMTFDLHDEFLIYTTDTHTCCFISLNSDLSSESVTITTSSGVRDTMFVAMATLRLSHCICYHSNLLVCIL